MPSKTKTNRGKGTLNIYEKIYSICMEHHLFSFFPYVTSAETQLAELPYRVAICKYRAPKETSSHIHDTVNVIFRRSSSKQDIPNTQFKGLEKIEVFGQHKNR